MKYIHEYFSQVFFWATIGIIGLMGALIRKIFTNERKLELLEKEIKARNDLAEKDNEKINMIYEQVQEIRKWVLDKS